jgi:GTP cyclohydrolase I
MSISTTFFPLFPPGARSRRRRLTAEEQLIMDLFRGYDTDARAVVNTNNTVKVEIEFVLLRIQKLVSRCPFHQPYFTVHLSG